MGADLIAFSTSHSSILCSRSTRHRPAPELDPDEKAMTQPHTQGVKIQLPEKDPGRGGERCESLHLLVWVEGGAWGQQAEREDLASKEREKRASPVTTRQGCWTLVGRPGEQRPIALGQFCCLQETAS